MNNSVRVIIEIVLAIALVLAIVLFFNQSNTLSETENSLVYAQETGTSIVVTAAEIATQGASDLSESYATATQSAEEAATVLSQANASTTQLAERAATALSALNNIATEAAEELGNVASTATQSFENFTDEIDTIAHTATQNSEHLTEIEELATQFAENVSNTATHDAAQFANINATIEAMNSQLATSVHLAATNQAALDAAQQEISIQATALAENVPSDDASETTDFNLVRYEFGDIALSIPDTYLVLDPKNDIDDNIDILNDLGDEYEVIVQLYKDNAETFLVFAVPEKSKEEVVFELVAIQRSSLDLEFDVDLDEYLNALLDLIGDDVDIVESAVTTLAEQPVGKQILSVNADFVIVIRVRYVFKIDNTFYELNFLTTEAQYESHVALFEAMAATFEVVE